MMGLFLFLVFIVFAILSGVYAFRRFASEPERYRDEQTGEVRLRSRGVSWGALFPLVVFIVLAFLSLGLIQIDAGHVGVVRRLGAVTGEVMQPGLQWMPPFISSVDDVDVRVRQVRIADDPNTPDRNEAYAAASKEQQDLFMNLTLNYHVDPAAAPRIINEIGQDFEAKIVLPRFLDIPKSVTDDYPTVIVLNSRDEIRLKSTDLLRTELARYGFVVDSIALENFGYSVEYNAAIEAKQIEQQRVETEKQRLEQAKIAAQTAVEQAKGEANAQVERARGESEANRLVAASLTDEILTNRYIEKLVPGIHTMLVPSDNGFILDLGGAVLPTPAPTPAAP